MPDLLIELLSEEIPARMQTRAAEDLRKRMTDGLVEAGLTYAHGATRTTPRRLVLALEGVSAESAAVREERKGPRTDAPEKAVEGFLRSTGLTKDQLEIRDDKKGQVYFAVIERPGRPATELVAEVLEAVIRDFPWPKSMRWGAGTLRWVRPLRSILCILSDETGAQVVPMDIDGITAGDVTSGHPVMNPSGFAVSGFEDYDTKLKAANVILSADERSEHIQHEAESLAFAQGLELVADKGLLAEVAGLVEWPVVLMGDIGEAFLDLPPEVLKTSMKEHQKFFSVRNSKTGRIEKFVTVANIETPDDGALILAGNQKVLAARLSDAKFFWENDLRTVTAKGLSGMAAPLADVTFHRKLGTQADRIKRIATLAREIAPVVGAAPDMADQAARIAKADLASEMVYEFPELQGTMGRYYAEAEGLSSAVAAACETHYSPLGPTDDVPTEPVSMAVALADKIDMLTGFWAIDEKPTGSKDPFALRRAALGVIRIVLENGVRATLLDTLTAQFERVLQSVAETANSERALLAQGFRDKTGGHSLSGGEVTMTITTPIDGRSVDNRSIDLLSFLHDRLKIYLRDQGIRHDVIDACIAMDGSDDLVLVTKRAEALSAVLQTEDGENLIQAFKRADNILTQAQDKDGVEYSFGADPKFAETDEERALFAALDSAEATIAPAMKSEDFAAAMHAMAALRGPIDTFFEAVQVNADSEVLRRNRLNLLHRIVDICTSVADLRRLEG